MTKLKSIADVEKAMNDLMDIEGKIVVEAGEANRSIAEVRQDYVDTTAVLTEQSKRLRSAIEAWAEENREDEEIFQPGKKSLELTAGTIAFRLGPESLTLRKGFATDDVIERLREENIKAGIKVPDPTLDKGAIKKLLDQGKIDEKTLKTLGLEITQNESITISLNTVETPEKK